MSKYIRIPLPEALEIGYWKFGNSRENIVSKNNSANPLDSEWWSLIERY